MPIPDLGEEGFLPIGIHECSLDEIRERFGRFQRTDQRTQLYARLIEFAQEARKTGLVEELIINGSFVTGEANPGDVDLVIGVSSAHDFAADLRPFEYNILSKRCVRKFYGFDVLGVAVPGTPAWREYTDFFQQVKNRPERRKGILRVRL